MITISGMNVTRESGVPVLYDIGYSLSQIPRFAGHTTRRWSVLNHLYACCWYAQQRKYAWKIQLYALLHDAHECITSDVPQPWKTDDLRDLQRELDTRIYASLGLSLPPLVTDRIIHQIDNQMVYSEAVQFAPQVAQAIVTPGPNFRDSIDIQDTEAAAVIDRSEQWLLGMSPMDCGYDYEQFVRTLQLGVQNEAHQEVSRCALV